jgi:hypothetical protein
MKTATILVLLAIARPPVAVAQVERGDTLSLTLNEALRLARTTNPAYRQAVNEASLNAVESRTTWFGEVLPQATLNLFGTNFYGNVRRRAQDNFGNPIENPAADWVYFSETSQSSGTHSSSWSYSAPRKSCWPRARSI